MLSLAVKTLLVDELRKRGHNPGAIFMADLGKVLEVHGYEIVKKKG